MAKIHGAGLEADHTPTCTHVVAGLGLVADLRSLKEKEIYGPAADRRSISYTHTGIVIAVLSDLG